MFGDKPIPLIVLIQFFIGIRFNKIHLCAAIFDTRTVMFLRSTKRASSRIKIEPLCRLYGIHVNRCCSAKIGEVLHHNFSVPTFGCEKVDIRGGCGLDHEAIGKQVFRCQSSCLGKFGYGADQQDIGALIHRTLRVAREDLPFAESYPGVVPSKDCPQFASGTETMYVHRLGRRLLRQICFRVMCSLLLYDCI